MKSMIDWQESEGERKYRQKQEALRNEGAKAEIERRKRNEEYAKALSKDYTSKFLLGVTNEL